MTGPKRVLAPLLLAAAACLVVIAAHPAVAQDNSCRWANDGECDEPRYGGTGACPDGTDHNDCAAPAGKETALPADIANSCEWANDGQCDENRAGGTGLCADGTDTNDCGPADTAPQGKARM